MPDGASERLVKHTDNSVHTVDIIILIKSVSLSILTLIKLVYIASAQSYKVYSPTLNDDFLCLQVVDLWIQKIE